MYKNKSVKITKEGRERLGKVLLEFRESKGLSLRAASKYIAEVSGDGSLGFSSLGDIESGKRDIKLENLLLLSQIGYGNLTFSEMVDILTNSRLSLCERRSDYRVFSNEAIAV